jgi:hypothetical protein
MIRVCTPFFKSPNISGPSLLWSEFIMVRVYYGPSYPVTSQTIKSRTAAEKALRRPGMLCNFMRHIHNSEVFEHSWKKH